MVDLLYKSTAINAYKMEYHETIVMPNRADKVLKQAA